MAGNGSRDLALVAARLRAGGGHGGLRLQMVRGLKAAAKPIIPAVQAAARAQLPKGGGLNEQVAGQKVSVSVRLGARTAGVRLVTRAPDTAQTDQGYVRHPSPRNNRKVWIHQPIPAAAGWWSKTIPAHSADVTAELLKVMEETAAAIQL